MNNDRFALIEFQGDQLLTIWDGQTIRVAMKPLVEALGVDWRSQRTKIMADAVLAKGVALSTTPSEGGPQQTLTLPIDLMQGWLFKLNPERVAPEARERVIAYQRECYQVLNDYWVKGAAINSRMGGSVASTAVGDVLRLIDAVKAERDPVALAVKHALLTQVLEQRNLPVPAIDAFNQPSPADREAEALLAQIDAMVEAGTIQNAHRKKQEFIAVRRKDLEARGIVIRLALRDALIRHARYKRYGSVSIAGGGSAHCWVFRA